MSNNELTPEEYIEIAEKVRSGEYFREAHIMLDIDIHDPMSERYWYIAVTFMALLIAIVSFFAWSGFYPLAPKVPFVFATNDIIEEVPSIRSLVNYHNEDPDVALRRHLVGHYVKTREEYDATTFDRAHNAIESMSTKLILEEYDAFNSPQNPNSPIAKFQRIAKRQVVITNVQPIEEKNNSEENKLAYRMLVSYDARVVKGELVGSYTKHQVDIAFQYKNIKVDEKSGRILPYGFIVTKYQNKDL